MIQNLKKVITIGSVLAVMAAALFGVASASALDSSTIRISPVRSDIEIMPGASKEVVISITNLGKEEVSLQAIENDFVSTDENGTPALILDPRTTAPTHSLKKFMSPVADVTIPGGQTKQAVVKITVPASAQAGGYFGAVRFVPAKKFSGSDQINLNTSLSSIILLRVPGATLEKLTLTSLDIREKGDTIDTWFYQEPKNLELSARFENKGNVQASPFGKISVKRGNDVIYETDFNSGEPRDMILPDGARRWSVPLKNIEGFGKYTVYATFTYGEDNKTIDIEKSFWVVPWQVIIYAGIGVGAFIVLLIIIGMIHRFRHRHRKPRLGGGQKYIRPRRK